MAGTDAGMDAFMDVLAHRLREAPSKTTDGELPCRSYSNTDQTKDALYGPSTPQAFHLGTGASLYASAMLPAMLDARHEIILVTCFWAASKSLRDLSAALTTLAARRASQPTQPARPTLRVRICFSSRSLLQKLLHTADAKGYTYPPDTWEPLLGLPAPDVLRSGGIELVAKSIFFLPFSVMHPKLVVVDRERAFLPSCNVSWEPWLEGCVEVKGDVVQRVLQFYGATWGDDLPPLPGTEPAGLAAAAAQPSASAESPPTLAELTASGAVGVLDANGPGSISVRFGTGAAAPQVATAILPSSHHRDPQFRPFFWQSHAPLPKTPLNLAIVQLLGLAQSQIYIQTPNVTAEAVVAALLDALARGVHVTIVTGENMMMYEQIVTAFTTTASCLRGLVKRHEANRAHALASNMPYGHLQISYFQPLSPRDRRRAAADEEQAVAPPQTNAYGFAIDTDEPVQSHIKLTIVDGAYTVLGSGNMDRASFFTSQELGILFHSPGFAAMVQMAVDRVLQGRLKAVYPKQQAPAS